MYLQIYLWFLLVGTAAAALSAVATVVLVGRPMARPLSVAAATGARFAVLPDPGDPGFGEAFRSAAAEAGGDVTIYGEDGAVVASIGRRAPPGPPGPFLHRAGLGLRVALPQGGQVSIATIETADRRGQGVVWLAGLALVMAAGCYPLARRITRRLEAVREAVGRWGGGALGVRVPVVGQDEVADVARTFNEAAERVERLFEAQRRTLASASHELRSPLARLRMAVELLDDGSAMVDDARRDIEDLDATVGDLLQVGRIQASTGPEDPRPVELRALAEEEVQRIGAVSGRPGDVRVEGGPWTVEGDERLLRRLIRNLVENALRYGQPPVEVRIVADGLEVHDRGVGVDETLRERIFEPFFRPAGHAEGRDGGVGLGLHLVREIARHHGGTARCEARPGGGSRFVVSLGRAGGAGHGSARSV